MAAGSRMGLTYSPFRSAIFEIGYINPKAELEKLHAHNMIPVLRKLIDFGHADVSVIDRRGSNILESLIGYSSVESIQWLIEREDLNVAFNNDKGETAIMVLLFYSSFWDKKTRGNLLKFFIENGVDIHAQCSRPWYPEIEGWTALHFAVNLLSYIDDVDCVCALLSQGTDPHTQDYYGVTPTALALRSIQSF